VGSSTYLLTGHLLAGIVEQSKNDARVVMDLRKLIDAEREYAQSRKLSAAAMGVNLGLSAADLGYVGEISRAQELTRQMRSLAEEYTIHPGREFPYHLLGSRAQAAMDLSSKIPWPDTFDRIESMDFLRLGLMRLISLLADSLT
jgi:hypothetical protein